MTKVVQKFGKETREYSNIYLISNNRSKNTKQGENPLSFQHKKKFAKKKLNLNILG